MADRIKLVTEVLISMLYPPMAELVDKVGSRYLLVNLVAPRAGHLAEGRRGGEVLERKPISTAIDEVYTGKLTIREKCERRPKKRRWRG